MLTVIETGAFGKKAQSIWSDDQYQDFLVYIANNPSAGDVVPGSGGARKIRWTGKQKGKRGGVRVIYVTSRQKEIWLLTMYAKNERENIPAHELGLIRKAICDDNNG